MDHITVSGQVVPVPSNWSDTDIKNFAAGIKSNADHITVGGQAYAVPSSWSDKSIQDYANALKTGMQQSAPKQAPGFLDQLRNDPKKLLKDTFNKTAQSMNVENVLGQVASADSLAGQGRWADAWDELRGLLPGATSSQQVLGNQQGTTLQEQKDFAADTYQKVKDRDYSGAGANVLSVALANAEHGPAIRDAAVDTAQSAADATAAAQKYGKRVGANLPAVGDALKGVGQSMAPNMKKGAIATAVASGLSTVAPGLGHAATGVITIGTLYKAAAAAVRDGSMGKLGKSIGELTTKPTTAEGIADAEARSPWLDNYANQSYADVVAKQQASKVPAPAPAPVDPVKSAPVRKAEPASQPMPTTKVEISSKVSPDAATSTMGTKAPAGDATSNYLQGIRNPKPAPVQGPTRTPAWRNVPEAEAPAAQPVQPVNNATLASGRTPGGIQNQSRTVEPTQAPVSAPVNGNSLDATTHQKLIDATRNGKLEALPADTKVALIRAVKAGDSAKVQSILDDRLHSGVSRVDTSVVNKVAALSKYAIDHSLDLNDIRNSAALVDKFVKDNNLGNPTSKQLRTAAAGNPEVLDAMNQVQGFSDAAYGHSVTKHGLIGNKRGRYDGVSLDTIDMVRRAVGELSDKVKQNTGQTPAVNDNLKSNMTPAAVEAPPQPAAPPPAVEPITVAEKPAPVKTSSKSTGAEPTLVKDVSRTSVHQSVQEVNSFLRKHRTAAVEPYDGTYRDQQAFKLDDNRWVVLARDATRDARGAIFEVPSSDVKLTDWEADAKKVDQHTIKYGNSNEAEAINTRRLKEEEFWSRVLNKALLKR